MSATYALTGECEYLVSEFTPSLFTEFGGEEVVENKSFKDRAPPALSNSFLDRTVEAQGPEKRH